MAASAFLQQLFPALLANGATTSVPVQASFLEVDVFVQDTPTWGGGTLALQTSPDGGTTWMNVTGATWTSGGGRLTASAPINAVGGTALRLNLTGATSPNIIPNIVARRVEFRQVDSDVLLTANGVSKTFRASALPERIGVFMFGTFGGGTLAFQVSPDNGTSWYNVHTRTANDYTRVDAVREYVYRFSLTGATSPSIAMQLA